MSSAALSREFPGLEVRLHLVDPEEADLQLLSRRADAVITDDYPGTEGVPAGGIHSTVLGAVPVRAYLPDPTADGDLERIPLLPWVMEGHTSGSAQWALRVCREGGFEPIVANESADLLFHLRMVEQGLAAAFLPDMVLRETGCTLTASSWLPTDQHRNIPFLVRDGSESHPTLVAVRDAVATALSP